MIISFSNYFFLKSDAVEVASIRHSSEQLIMFMQCVTVSEFEFEKIKIILIIKLLKLFNKYKRISLNIINANITLYFK